VINPADYEFLSGFLKKRSGLTLSNDKHYLFESRIVPLLRRFDLTDFTALTTVLKGQPDGVIGAAVVEAMTTNESLFFRDKTPFEDFARTVLPALHAARSPERPLRIWCAAASTGQEPYSLTMALHEPPLLGARKVEILGTDISTDVLERARAGRYNQFEVQRGMTVQKLLKHFTKSGDWWEIKPQLRAMVDFRKFNLLDSFAGLGTFDVIFCRNVLIYFDTPTKKSVLERMAKVLAPDGYLFLGAAETPIGITELYKSLPGCRNIYTLNREPAAAPAAPKARG